MSTRDGYQPYIGKRTDVVDPTMPPAAELRSDRRRPENADKTEVEDATE